MTKLTLLSQNPQGLLLTWPQHDLANRYRLEYLTDTFAYRLVKYLDQNTVFIPRDHFLASHPYRVTSVRVDEASGQELVLESTDLFDYTAPEPLSLVAIKSYEGASLSFQTESLFDYYRLYEVTDRPQLLMETEDCQVTGEVIREGVTYQVEAYKKDEAGQLTLAALSAPYTCSFRRPLAVVPPKLSVIVPVYNCQAFLSRTVDSILASTFQELEVILVNDGSADRSGEICDWYQANYPNVQVIHQVNSGPSFSRNQGMDRAKGEFLAFVDSDDLVHPDMYQKLYAATQSQGTDIAIAQTLMRIDLNQSKLVLESKDIANRISNHSYAEVIAGKGTHRNVYFVAVWNKIVRTAIARKVRFLEAIPYYEDTAYTSSLYTYIDRFTLVKGAYYIWDKRKQNTVGTATTQSRQLPTLLKWRYYLLTLVAPLSQGNRNNPAVMETCALDIMKKLLEDYDSHSLSPQIKALFEGMVKFYVREYQIPMDRFAGSSDEKVQKLYASWQKIQASESPECSGWEDVVTS